MTPQKEFARTITVTREMLEKAARCDQTWRELYVAIETHQRIEIQPNIRSEGD